MVEHLQHKPAEPVSHFVESLWLVRGRLPGGLRHLLLPDGMMVIIFNLGTPQRLCDRADLRRHAVFHRSWVSGQQPQPILIEQSGDCHLVGIRFHPGGAWPFFRFSLGELAGQVVELESIWGAAAARVREELGELSGGAAQLQCLERSLAWRLRREPPPDPRIRLATARLLRGQNGVQQIADETGWSHKHFVQEFTRHVGLTPKYFGRVQRLQRTLRWIGPAVTVDWADAAILNGFYDQAHLVNEFRELAGVTPSHYLQRRSPYPGYLSVA